MWSEVIISLTLLLVVVGGYKAWRVYTWTQRKQSQVDVMLETLRQVRAGETRGKVTEAIDDNLQLLFTIWEQAVDEVIKNDLKLRS